MDKVIKALESVDKEDLELLDMIQKLTKFHGDNRRWTKKQQKDLKRAMAHLSNCLGTIEHVEIGPPAAPTWTTQSEKE